MVEGSPLLVVEEVGESGALEAEQSVIVAVTLALGLAVGMDPQGEMMQAMRDTQWLM